MLTDPSRSSVVLRRVVPKDERSPEFTGGAPTFMKKDTSRRECKASIAATRPVTAMDAVSRSFMEKLVLGPSVASLQLAAEDGFKEYGKTYPSRQKDAARLHFLGKHVCWEGRNRDEFLTQFKTSCDGQALTAIVFQTREIANVRLPEMAADPRATEGLRLRDTPGQYRIVMHRLDPASGKIIEEPLGTCAVFASAGSPGPGSVVSPKISHLKS